MKGGNVKLVKPGKQPRRMHTACSTTIELYRGVSHSWFIEDRNIKLAKPDKHHYTMYRPPGPIGDTPYPTKMGVKSYRHSSDLVTAGSRNRNR